MARMLVPLELPGYSKVRALATTMKPQGTRSTSGARRVLQTPCPKHARSILCGNQLEQWNNLCALGEVVTSFSRIHDDEAIQLEIADRRAHRGCQRGCVHAFALHANAATPLEEHEVDFRALVRGPEIGLVRRQRLERLFDGIAFPGGPNLGMKLQVALPGNPQKRVQQAAIAHVYLGSLDLPFAEVLKPGRQLPKHEDPREEIEVAAHGRLADGQGAGQFGAIPGLSVIVSQHA